MLNKPRIKTWAQPNLMCEPTRIELRQDLINSAMTPMFKATTLEVRNDEKIQTFQPNSTGFNPITPFRPKTQRGIGLFQQRIEQQAQMSTSTNQFSSINKSKIDSVSTNSMISSLLSTPVIVRYHSYIYVSTKLNFTSKFFTRTGVFRQNKRIYFSTLHFDKIFMM